MTNCALAVKMDKRELPVVQDHQFQNCLKVMKFTLNLPQMEPITMVVSCSPTSLPIFQHLHKVRGSNFLLVYWDVFREKQKLSVHWPSFPLISHTQSWTKGYFLRSGSKNRLLSFKFRETLDLFELVTMNGLYGVNWK